MSWGQGHYVGGNRPTPCKPRPLTPASDSCDSILPTDLPEPPKDFVSLSSLVSGWLRKLASIAESASLDRSCSVGTFREGPGLHLDPSPSGLAA